MKVSLNFLVISLLLLCSCSGAKTSKVEVVNDVLPIADPYILVDGDKYYAYGTFNPDGIDCYWSTDLEQWHYAGAALLKENSYGDKWFWAPEVYNVGGKYYMFYSADLHMNVAVSDSPTGPFVQAEKKPLMEEPNIDTSVFFDTDGKAYLYYAHFTPNDGEYIHVVELNDDLLSIKPETDTYCIKAEEEWELIWPKVVEGPSVLKKDDIYYLIYSANGYESHDYAIGVATATSPLGPWTKSADNPILRRYEGMVGVGHGAPFTDLKGKSHYVFHAHKSAEEVHPRTSFIVDMKVDSGKVSMGGGLIRPVVVK